jgi:glutamine synthetase
VFASSLEKAGLKTDTFLPEYGACQFEATLAPSIGIQSADQSLILKELARATAHRFNQRVSFSPIVGPDTVGNGVHIHFSFLDKENTPVMYDANRDFGLSKTTGMFCAGILKYMPAITALMAPNPLSYNRLVPHKWSAAFNNLAVRDREAGLRICPVIEGENIAGSTGSQFNLEYRAADASASPYLQLAALVRAGLQGIKEKLSPPSATQGDLSLMSKEELLALNVTRLPESLEKALEIFAAEPVLKEWFSSQFVDIYLKHKYQEIKDALSVETEKRYEYYSRRY